MDAIQPKFSMKNEYRSQMPTSPSLSGSYTIILRLKTLETCYFDIPVLDDAIKLAESLDALIINAGKSRSLSHPAVLIAVPMFVSRWVNLWCDIPLSILFSTWFRSHSRRLDSIFCSIRIQSIAGHQRWMAHQWREQKLRGNSPSFTPQSRLRNMGSFRSAKRIPND